MLYNLLAGFPHDGLFYNLFRYITFRAGCATLTALLMCFFIGPKIISWLKSKQGEGQPIRTDGPETHFAKKGTPTMGGLMTLLSAGTSILLWADLKNPYIWVVLLVTIGFGLIGFADDYLKLTKRNAKGLSSRTRILIQIAITVTASYFISRITPAPFSQSLALPFFKTVLIQLGFAFFIFAPFVMIGAANAVNLTDGLDGLATVPIIIAAVCFGIIAYLAGNIKFADYLQIHSIPGAGELAILCSALVGASLGFLWFNTPPAQVFMGDTGSLSQGAALGTIAVITKHELVLAIIGGLFVIETASVIIQVASYKLRGKRVFLMAPLHHHFEKKGWSEATVVIRFWIIAFIMALIGLSTLKLR